MQRTTRKRLSLSPITLRNLTSADMRDVGGGVQPTVSDATGSKHCSQVAACLTTVNDTAVCSVMECAR